MRPSRPRNLWERDPLLEKLARPFCGAISLYVFPGTGVLLAVLLDLGEVVLTLLRGDLFSSEVRLFLFVGDLTVLGFFCGKPLNVFVETREAGRNPLVGVSSLGVDGGGFFLSCSPK